jgi:hypothetical protein
VGLAAFYDHPTAPPCISLSRSHLLPLPRSASAIAFRFELTISRTAALAPLRPLANLGLSANFATNAHGGINFNRLRPHNRQVLGIGAGSSRGEHGRGGNAKGASGHGHGATGSMSGEW